MVVVGSGGGSNPAGPYCHDKLNLRVRMQGDGATVLYGGAMLYYGSVPHCHARVRRES